jgi:hypothetical protein
MKGKINLFAAWFMVLQIFFSSVLAQVGAGLLGALGMPAPLADQYGWLVGALILLLVLIILRRVMGELPPGTGKPGGKGYKFGHGLVLASSVLALGTYILPFFISGIQNPGTLDAVSTLIIGLMYPALGLFGVGMSFIYQSALPVVKPKP